MGRAEDRGAEDGLGRSLHSDELPERVTCPFCEGEDTEQFASFGSAVSTSQYYCRRCRTVFEFMKRRDRRQRAPSSGSRDPQGAPGEPPDAGPDGGGEPG